MNESVKFLKNLAQELKDQPTDCQAAPRFFRSILSRRCIRYFELIWCIEITRDVGKRRYNVL